MEFEKIKELMKTLNNSDLMDFELKLGEKFYLRMNKYKTCNSIPNKNYNEEPSLKSASNNSNFSDNIEKDVISKQIVIEEAEQIKEGNTVLSPIVGTFYSSNSPSKPAFVKVGDKVQEGDTLCIIEAMKVMNEIKSQFSGEIAEIFIKNEDMVEYNQPLFKII